jgi:probable HAF family extracellular repeat protein
MRVHRLVGPHRVHQLLVRAERGRAADGSVPLDHVANEEVRLRAYLDLVLLLALDENEPRLAGVVAEALGGRGALDANPNGAGRLRVPDRSKRELEVRSFSRIAHGGEHTHDVAVAKRRAARNPFEHPGASEEGSVDAAAVDDQPPGPLALECAVGDAGHQELGVRLQRDVVVLGQASDGEPIVWQSEYAKLRAVGTDGDDLCSTLDLSRCRARFHLSPISRPWNGGTLWSTLDERARYIEKGRTMSRLFVFIFMLIVTPAAALATSAPSSAGEAKAGWVITDLGTLGPVYRDSSASAINESGQIVGGSGAASGKQHAFVWQDGKMSDLGTLGGRDSGAEAINDHGQIIGTSLTPKPSRTHAFIWQNGKMTDLGTLGGRSSRPRAINEQGQVVGESFTATGKVHAFVWQDGKMTDLGTLGGRDSTALAINERGQVVGSSSTASGRTHAFLWQNGKMSDLGTLGRSYSDSGAVAINDRGQIVGDSFKPTVTQSGQPGHAFLWQNGKMADLGTLGSAYTRSHAEAINQKGQIVGESSAANGKRRTVLWQNGKIRAVAALGGGFSSVIAINERGQVIGSSVPAGGSVVHAFLWQAGRASDLGTLGGAESDAAAFNEQDQVVGVSNTASGKRHAVLWTRMRES